MPRKTRCNQLLDALQAEKGLVARGYTFEITDDTDLLIERRGHVCGIWAVSKTAFAWTDPSYGESTFRTKDVGEAVAHTIKALVKR